MVEVVTEETLHQELVNRDKGKVSFLSSFHLKWVFLHKTYCKIFIFHVDVVCLLKQKQSPYLNDF